MLFIIAFVAFVFLGFKVAELSNEVKQIKQRLDAGASVGTSQTMPVAQSIAQPIPQKPAVPLGFPTMTPIPQSGLRDEGPDAFAQFTAWFSHNWLLKIGVFLILIGFGWFISYAFVHDWIGPVGRVALGLISGLLLMFLGTMRMEMSATQGKMFLVLGSALVFITSYAARTVYGFFTPGLSLAFAFMVSAYVSYVAIHFNTKILVMYGLVIAYFAPVVTTVAQDSILLFSYLVVVSLISIWLASYKGWREINVVALIGFGFFTLPYMLGINALSEAQELFVLGAIYLMAFAYFLASIVGVIKSKDSADQSDIVVAIFDAAMIIMATLAFVPVEMQSWMLIIWILVFSIGSYIAFSSTQKENIFYVYALISIVLIAVATAIEFDGKALLYAYAIESAVISVAGYLVTRRLDVGYGLSLLMAGPVIMSLPSLVSDAWDTGIRHEDFAILIVVGLVLCGLGFFYYISEDEKEKYNDSSVSKAYTHLITIGSLYFIALIWLCAGATFVTEGTAVLVSLVSYTLIGIICYFYGLMANKDNFRVYGGALLIFVILRLLIVDVWDMALASRIVTFISIGLLFISTAFIGKKAKGE